MHPEPARHGPLHGVRVIELAAMGPVPLACMILADLGAEVILVDRPDAPDTSALHRDIMNRGRRSILLDLKQPDGVRVLKDLVRAADVLVEGYRPGVVERLGIGPDDLHAVNPRLVYGRMTGWGQAGPNAPYAGHDLSYLAVTGVLDAIRRPGERPVPPLNMVGDFGGGAMFLLAGVLAALLEARRSGEGQVVDAAMTEGAAVLSTLFYGLRDAGEHNGAPGTNLLDGGAPFYDTYETSDGRFVAVAAIEPEFYDELCRLTGVDRGPRWAYREPANWPELRQRLTDVFRTRTRDQWAQRVELSDACLAPVLSFDEAPQHPQLVAREAYVDVGGIVQPAPAPRFSRTPAAVQGPPPRPGADSALVLRDWLGLDGASIGRLQTAGVLGAPDARDAAPDVLPYPPDLPRTWVGAFLHRVAQFADEPFLKCGPDWRTWRQVHEDTDAVAAGLQSVGVTKGTRLAFLSETSCEMLDAYIGAAKVAAVQIPLNIYLKGEFLLHQLGHCRASVVIVDEQGYSSLRPVLGQLPELRTLITLGRFDVDETPGITVVPFATLAASDGTYTAPEIAPNDTFQVSYTSGTTGPAKGCIYSNAYILRAGASVVYLMGLTHDDVQLCVWPLNHNSGAVAVSLSLVAGSRLVMEPKFVAEGFVQRAADVGATYFVGMGPVSRQLLEQPPHPADLANSLRVSLMVPSSVEVQDELRARFGFDSTSEMWAQGECLLVTGNPIDGARFRGTSGRPLPDVEVALFSGDDQEVPIGEVGEICLRPRRPGVMFDGYLDDPAATIAAMRNLWYHSGDMGRRDEFGNITFVDRAKDMLRRSGENVSSFELEAAVRGFPSVADTAVTETGTVASRESDLVAWIVPAPGLTFDVHAFAEHLWDTVPYFAVPRHVALVDELPTTVSGRVMKHLLRDRDLPGDAWDLKQLGLLTPAQRRR